MIFKRKIYNELLQWKRTDEGRTAVLIQGARRVGKSTIAEEFATNEYETPQAPLRQALGSRKPALSPACRIVSEASAWNS